jgi:5-aminolevulinate synthase
LKVKHSSAGLPIAPTATHIVPVTIGDPQKCRAASDLLLARHGIYIQPIDYPTVPRGTKRLRTIPTPFHHDDLIDHLTEAMLDVWRALDLPLSSNRPTRTVVAKQAPVQIDAQPQP